MRDNKWVRLLAYVKGLVNQRLLLRNEYLIAENRILRSHLPTRLRRSDPERSTLAEIGKRLGERTFSWSPPPRSGISRRGLTYTGKIREGKSSGRASRHWRYRSLHGEDGYT